MATELCPTHNLRFDPALHQGCVLCRRGQPSDAAPDPVPVVGGRRRLALVGGGALVVLALSVGAVQAGVLSTASGWLGAGAAEPFEVTGPDYYPMPIGSEWTYSHQVTLGDSSPDTSERHYVVIEPENPSPGAVRIHEPGRGLLNQMAMEYRLTPEGVETSQGYLSAQKTSFEPPFVELPTTLRSQEVWAWKGTSKGYAMQMESVLEGKETLTTPAGTFETIRIRRTLLGVEGAVSKHWYAAGVGLVRAESDRPANPPLIPKSRVTVELLSYSIAQTE